MTEADWLSGTDPAPLARFADNLLTDRRRLLFMAGCCRRVWELFVDPRFREVVEVAEELADNRVGENDLIAAADAAPQPDDPVWCLQTYRAVAAIPEREFLTAADACEAAAGHFAEDRIAQGHPLHDEIRRLVEPLGDGRELEAETEERVMCLTNEIWAAGAAERVERMAAERAAQTALIRCLVGNPFRPAAVDPRWLTSDVVELARGLYAERAFDRLPILADALQDAGCASEDVLSHCRADATHARGCWVVDSVLRASVSGSP
jgi:hypothetical protein